MTEPRPAAGVEDRLGRHLEPKMALPPEHQRDPAREGELASTRERELAFARRIQLSLMPGSSPALAGVEVATAYRAAREVGGDFYDTYELPARPGMLGIAVADVTGKGVTAALMMAFSRAVLRSAAYNGSGPADALRRTNRVLANEVRTGLFLTALVLELDGSSGALRFASAGHEPPLLLRAGVPEPVELPAGGAMLGLFDELEPEERTLDLAPGDLVLAYTDGVTDALDSSGDRFGDVRLRELLGRGGELSARDVVDRILAGVHAFAGSEPPADDITLVAIRRSVESGDVPHGDEGRGLAAPAPVGAPGGHDGPEPVIAGARFGHVNVIARDWRSLAAFYAEVFGCRLVPPERDYSGADLDAGTGLAGAHLRGAHFRLPGHGPDGPTLEIYTYDSTARGTPASVDQPGWGHVAFGVPDVHAAREAVLAHGGSAVGEIVTLATADGRHVTWCYVRDPEGNPVELQAWS